jgi:hypothetical protein
VFALLSLFGQATFTLPPNPQISVIAAATGSTLTVTAGEGI